MKPLVRLKALVLGREASPIKDQIIENIMEITLSKQEKYFLGTIVSRGITKQSFSEGDEVLVYIPRDYPFPLENLSNPIEFDECLMIPLKNTNKKEGLIAGSVALKIFNSLFQKGRFVANESVIVIGLSYHYAYILLQIILNLKGTVTLIMKTADELEKMQLFLDSQKLKDSKFINLLLISDEYSRKIIEKNGNLGVDLILDFLETHQDQEIKNFINILSPNGRWVVCDPNLQINPPETRSLFLKNACLCFCFEENFSFFKFQIGKALNMIEQMILFLEKEIFKVFIESEVKFSQEYEKFSSFSEKKTLGSIIIDLEKK